jgi:hypothetical protein
MEQRQLALSELFASGSHSNADLAAARLDRMGQRTADRDRTRSAQNLRTSATTIRVAAVGG